MSKVAGFSTSPDTSTVQGRVSKWSTNRCTCFDWVNS